MLNYNVYGLQTLDFISSMYLGEFGHISRDCPGAPAVGTAANAKRGATPLRRSGGLRSKEGQAGLPGSVGLGGRRWVSNGARLFEGEEQPTEVFCLRAFLRDR